MPLIEIIVTSLEEGENNSSIEVPLLFSRSILEISLGKIPWYFINSERQSAWVHQL